MALVFNPFTGNFDNVIASSSDMSFSNGSLNVNGDITLDSGGAFTTTVQAVTPTANRTISFPDQTGTVGLVNGANGTIQYNDAGTLKGNSDFTVDPDWNDAATVFTGLKLNVTDTASAAGSNLLDLQSGGSSKFRVSKLSIVTDLPLVCPEVNPGSAGFFLSGNTIRVSSLGYLGFSSTGQAFATPDVTLYRDSAGVVKVTDGSTGTGYIKQVPVLTANLPNAATVDAGTRGFVSDAGALTFNTPIGTGTGTPSANTTIPVFSDGSVWKAG